ncbi:hypothetical protein [Myroides injenensis]|uniref:hypothetical protein n=1 Tax=Myroides injenensis TaxID=1183151 RepID=UPI000287D520|nr:hypothetical protein [Myroides injenensis]
MENKINESFEVRNPKESVMSVGDWIVTLLIMLIPLVNIVMLFVWGFDNNGNRNRANWAKAQLIFMAIGIGLWILLILIIGSAAIFGSSSNGY